jgi:hypothetical protein
MQRVLESAGRSQVNVTGIPAVDERMGLYHEETVFAETKKSCGKMKKSLEFARIT